jgi:hypothetical protein
VPASAAASFCCCQLLLLPASAAASFCCCQLLMLSDLLLFSAAVSVYLLLYCDSAAVIRFYCWQLFSTMACLSLLLIFASLSLLMQSCVCCYHLVSAATYYLFDANTPSSLLQPALVSAAIRLWC